MSDYICKRTWISSPIKPRYDMLILNSANDNRNGKERRVN